MSLVSQNKIGNSRLAKQRMAASGWQLAVSAPHFTGGGILDSRIQEFKISKATNGGCLWPDAKSQRPVLISVF